MDGLLRDAVDEAAIPDWLSSRRGRLNPHALARVVAFIDGNLGERLTLEALARAACMSRFHFSRAFRASTGESPMAYVARRRLESAERLLIEGGRALCEIAAALGFCDQSHFTRRFRDRTGLTPGEFARIRNPR
jgi:AraC family transcriptional regulator